MQNLELEHGMAERDAGHDTNSKTYPCISNHHPYHADILPRMELCPSLAHNDIAWLAALPAVQLDAQHLWQ